MKKIFILLLLLCPYFGCKTIQADEAPNKNDWEYKIEITNPGTRSEGKLGHLFYKGKDIKGYFDCIIIEDNSYSYHLRKNLWDFGGYKKDENYIHREYYSDSGLSRTDIGKGWYFAGFKQKKKGTPSSWVWTKRDNTEAFVNPDNLDTFIQASGLGPKVPEGAAMTQKIKDVKPLNIANWEYKIEITKPGTRSEGKMGHLFYNGKEIKGYFDCIIIEDNSYSYYLRKNPWDFGGYKKDENYIHREYYADSGLSRTDIGKGWYFAGFKQKKKGTPSAWVWIKRDNTEAFVNPENLDAFIQASGLGPKIPGGVMIIPGSKTKKQ